MTAYRSVSALSREAQSSKVKGCVFAGALGDALGLYTEMVDRSSACEMWDEIGGLGFQRWRPRPHVDQFQRGDWTDDTDLAVTIVDSFVQCGGVDLKDLRNRGKRWLELGYPELGDAKGIGTGSTITTSLSDPIGEIDPHTSALLTWCELGNFDLGTSGAVMRTAPVALCHYQSFSDLVQHSIDIGAITHADPRSVAACVSIGVAIGAVLMGESCAAAEAMAREAGERTLVSYTDSLPTTIARACAVLKENGQSQRAEALLSQYTREEGEIKGRCSAALFRDCFSHSSLASIPDICSFSRDYAYKILSIAMWALRQTCSYEEVILAIVKEGGDADTNAAVAGSVYGAVVGFEGLPDRLLQGLVHRDWLDGKVQSLLQQLALPRL